MKNTYGKKALAMVTACLAGALMADNGFACGRLPQCAGDCKAATGAKPVAAFPGAANAKTGWKLVASEAGKVVYIPFEGYYESKGGRIESPRFKLDKPTGENAYYRLTFAAKSEVDGYWWVDFYDPAGTMLPDVNSRLYASKDWRKYDVMVPACPDAAQAVIAFVSKKGAFVRDVTLRRATLDEAVAWCDATYAALPKKLDCAVAQDAWSKLPKAKALLRAGKAFRVVLLGDSIMNDSYCGLMTALAQKAFPDTKIRFDISVRGSTGCWYYHEKAHFDAYVAKYRPDLVMIGGISNYLGPNRHTLREAEDNMVETIERCKALGAEVVVCTPAPSYEFRTEPTAKPFDRALLDETGGQQYFQQAYERRAAVRTGVQVWDLTLGPAEAIARSGMPLNWFKRDPAHNDDRGKQLIAQMFGKYFRSHGLGANKGICCGPTSNGSGCIHRPACFGRPVFVNYDDTHFLYSRSKLGIAVDETEIRSLVRQYRGTDVTDLLFCIGGRIADVPNKAKECWLDKYRQTLENGRPVCYANSYAPRLAHEIYEVKKLDPYALWCEEARACGIRPWLSFRLNDCHDNSQPTSFLHPNFFHDHPEYRRIRHRGPMGYFDRCFDFAIEAVRARELAFIREMLERYDADGIELDWQREIYCFVPGRESTETVNGFMRAVRAVCDAAAKRRGHPVRVMARVPADPDTALRFGFDAAAWADDGLVDVLVPCPRWDVTDNELPVDLWKRILRKTNVILAPGVELRVHDSGSKAWHATTEQLVGAAAAFYSQGADGLYLYNYFDDPDWKFHTGDAHRCYWKSPDQPDGTKAVCWCNQEKWLRMIGTPEKLLAAPRDHLLTFRDTVPLWGGVPAALPATVAAGQQRYLRLVTGPVPPKSRLTLRIGVSGGVAPKSVFVNSRPCTYRETVACPPPLSGDPFLCFDVPAYPERDALVEIVADKPLRVTHLDLQVRALDCVKALPELTEYEKKPPAQVPD